MTKEEFMHLQHSESVVAQMAATVFAGMVQKQEITLANEDGLVERKEKGDATLLKCPLNPGRLRPRF